MTFSLDSKRVAKWFNLVGDDGRGFFVQAVVFLNWDEAGGGGARLYQVNNNGPIYDNESGQGGREKCVSDFGDLVFLLDRWQLLESGEWINRIVAGLIHSEFLGLAILTSAIAISFGRFASLFPTIYLPQYFFKNLFLHFTQDQYGIGKSKR